LGAFFLFHVSSHFFHRKQGAGKVQKGNQTEMFEKVSAENSGRTYRCNASPVSTFVPLKCGPKETAIRTQNCKLIAEDYAASLRRPAESMGIEREVWEVLLGTLKYGHIQLDLSKIDINPRSERMRMFCFKLEADIQALGLCIKIHKVDWPFMELKSH